MEDDKNGGSAFAYATENGHQPGMSLRDYFAGQALAGFCVKNKHCAKEAYEEADAMLKERELYRGI